MPEEIEIETPSGMRAARVWGPLDAPAVLALHGWLDNAASFDHIAPRMPGVRVVALDLPGHGLSEHAPAGQLYPFVGYVAVVHEVAAALGWDSFCLLGHSLGAAVASIYAGTFPDRVRRLALIEGLGPLAEDAKHAPERLAKAIAQDTGKQGRRIPVYPSIEEVERKRLAAAWTMKPASVRTLLARGLKPTAGGVTWRSDPALKVASRMRLTEAQVLAFLQAIRCPTLLVRGDTGFPFVPADDGPRVQAVADLKIEALTGGHHLHLDEPEAVSAALNAFFAPQVTPEGPDDA